MCCAKILDMHLHSVAEREKGKGGWKKGRREEGGEKGMKPKLITISMKPKKGWPPSLLITLGLMRLYRRSYSSVHPSIPSYFLSTDMVFSKGKKS